MKNNNMQLAYHNGTIFTGQEMLTGKAVLVSQGVVADVIDEESIPGEYTRQDLQGMYLVPAFIDLQLYGGDGMLFSHELSTAALEATYAYCKNGGAAHFMITMATNSIEKFMKGIEVVQAYWHQGGKGLLGLHLEGPYLNPVKRGAHLEQYIKTPTPEEVALLLEKGKGVVRMMTIAPEVCSDAVIDLLLNSGIIVSAGHSNAVYREGMEAFNKGIPAATHLFNAMSAFQSREPGMVGAIYDHPGVRSSVVCDGVHVDFAAIRISKKLMKDRLFFITDAVTETTAGEYQHTFRGDRYTLPNGVLSGSALTMLQCVRNAVHHVGIDLEEALRMASLYPAALLGNDCRLGSIQKGYHASFAAIDKELRTALCIAE